MYDSSVASKQTNGLFRGIVFAHVLTYRDVGVTDDKREKVFE
jgi:hypothetical protein